MVDHKPGLCTVDLLYMLSLNIIDIYFGSFAALGIPGGQSGGFLKGTIRKLCIAGFYNNVRSGLPFGMKPPVTAVCYFESEFFVLKVVFAHIDIKTVGRNIMKGSAGGAFLFILAGMFFDIAAGDEFLSDLGQIGFCHGKIHTHQDRVQMFNLILCFLQKGRQGFFCPFELPIAVKIFFRVFCRRKLRIQRYGYRFVCIIIYSFKGFCPRLYRISIGMDQLAIDPVLVHFLRVLHLFCLQLQLSLISFQCALHDLSKIR